MHHDAAVWKCLCGLLDIRGTEEMRDRASLSLSSGGLGLRSATRGRDCAFWASWADAHNSQAPPGTWVFILWKPHKRLNTSGFESPEWGDVARGLQPRPNFVGRPHARSGSTGLAGALRSTWKNGSGPTSCGPDLIHQGRRCCGQAFLFVVSPSPWRPVSNRRSSASPLVSVTSLCSASCRCGRPLHPRGHHRAVCQVAGVLGRRGFPIESAVARVCREPGGRVCESKTWTSHLVWPRTTVVGRGRTAIVSRCTSQWMRRWCPQCAETEQVADNAPRQMVQP